MHRSAGLLGVPTDAEGAAEIASRSRGTPRIANRLLRRVRDYAQVRADGIGHPRGRARARSSSTRSTSSASTGSTAPCSTSLCRRFGGGPVGLSTLAVAVGEERETVEEVAEPFLVRQGFLARTPRGRVATAAAWRAPRTDATAGGAGDAHAVRADGGRAPYAGYTSPSVGRTSPTVDSPLVQGSVVHNLVAISPWSGSRCCSGCSSIRPQAPPAGTRRTCSATLEVGDEVMLTSGIFGTVRDLDDGTWRRSRSPTA